MIAFGWGGWSLIRPDPCAELSDELEEGASSISTAQSPTTAFPPSCHALAGALIRTKVLTEDDLRGILGLTTDPVAHLIRIAYDSLPTRARSTARLLSAVRAPSVLNGRFGCFNWLNPGSPDSVSKDAVLALREAGFLQPDDELAPDSLRMPRLVRRYVQRQAAFLDQSELRQVHLHCAEALENNKSPSSSIEEEIELQVHAAQSENIALAKRTASLLGSPLRELATKLSKTKHFSDAAELFQFLVDNFDPSDAYVFEYLGYNLARWDEREHLPLRHAQRIRDAYAAAHRLAPRVPLYHGRLLGYRAQLGEDVERELDGALMRYAAEHKDNVERISFFVEPVLHGLRRARRADVLTSLGSRWKALFDQMGPRLAKFDE